MWTFSLVVYAEPGVQEECLALQERLALDVNLLLLCAYAGVQGVMLSDNDVAVAAEAVASWHAQVVRPLRQARRALKPVARDDAAALRAEVKDVELKAERIEQAMLWSWWQERRTGASADRGAAAIANVRRLLEHYNAEDADPAQDVPNLLRTALRYTAKN